MSAGAFGAGTHEGDSKKDSRHRQHGHGHRRTRGFREGKASRARLPEDVGCSWVDDSKTRSLGIPHDPGTRGPRHAAVPSPPRLPR